MTSDIAIRVENLSKLYPAVAPRARHIGRAQQRHDRLRDALASAFRRQGSGARDQAAPVADPQPPAPCPERSRRMRAVGDAAFQKKCSGKIRAITKERRTLNVRYEGTDRV
jgi:hypothetical protein